MMTMFSQRIVYSVIAVLTGFGLVSCSETRVNHAALNIQGLSPFVAMAQPGQGWQEVDQATPGQQGFTLSMPIKQKSETMKVLFVCPSSREGVPHRIYYYLLTVNELDVITRVCRLPEGFRSRVDVYGEVLGVDGSQKKMAVLSLMPGVSEKAIEGYARNVAVRSQVDFLGFMGSVSNSPLPNTVAAEKVYIRRADPNVSTMFATDPTQIDFDFRDADNNGAANKRVSYLPAFSSVNTIINLGADIGSDVWHAQVNFISQNGSSLKLGASESVTNFTVNTVPVARYIVQNGAIVSTGEAFISENEGHELKVHVMRNGIVKYDDSNLEDDMDRMAIIFFHDSQSQMVTVNVPAKTASSVSAEHRFDSVANISSALSVRTQSVSDSNYGSARYVGVKLKGVAVEDPLAPGLVALEWNIYATPEALSDVGGVLELPMELVNLPRWKKQWLFGQAAVDVQQSSFLTSAPTKVVASYIFDNNFPGNTALAQVNHRATATQVLLKATTSP